MFNFNYKKDLASLGINDSMLTLIVTMIKNNEDYSCMLNSNKTITDVSPIFLNKSKASSKLYKVLKDLGIYNISYVVIKQGYYTFRCKLSKGDILQFEIIKDKKVNFKMATGLAILDFVDQALSSWLKEYEIADTALGLNNFSMSTSEEPNWKGSKLTNQKDQSNSEEVFIPNLGHIKINKPANASPEAAASLNDFLDQLRSGAIKLAKNEPVNNVIDGSCSTITE